VAGPVRGSYGTSRQRVFVLVDNDSAKGVFFTWEAAETFADENRYSLDQLMEYETRSDYPDHLQLMAAKWDDDWKFQGEWTQKTPNWSTPPEKVRLDHYHAKGNAFHLLRQREFEWEPGLLERVNPMAPDKALKSEKPASLPSVKPQWKPKISALKPLKHQQGPDKKTDYTPPSIPDQAVPEPVPQAPEADAPAVTSDAPPQAEKPKISLKKDSDKSELKLTPSAVPIRDEQQADDPNLGKSPKISFQKRKPLKLKTKGVPTPIPAFKAAPLPTVEDVSSKSSVELAQSDPNAMAPKKPVQAEFVGKPRRVWSLKLIFSVAVMVFCWIGGVFWVLRPEPTAAAIVTETTSLSSARVIVMEPKTIFFQMEVDPAHQERWIQSLEMNPIDTENPVSIPTYHALDTWERPSGFIRPPYSDVEVTEWWNLRLQEIRYGFTRTWEDGTILILDFESDTLIGWGRAKAFPEVMN
jgi:hypothetical protein